MDEDISFVNSSLKTFLLKVLDSAVDVENIMSIYQAYYFNQPYTATINTVMFKHKAKIHDISLKFFFICISFLKRIKKASA